MQMDRLFRRLCSVIFFTIPIAVANGQALSSAERKLTTVLNPESNLIPKDLQSSKSIIVISIDEESDIRGDWKTLAEAAHFYIRKLNIDAVLYFYIDDLIAGYDVQRAISYQLIRRDIKNILMLSKDIINGREQYIGVITPYNQKPDFVTTNQSAWKSQTTDLEILFRNLARSIDNADLAIENLLIIDRPEYYRGTDIIIGKRFEAYNTDLRIDRLAIPSFSDFSSLNASENPTDVQISGATEKEYNDNLQKNAAIEQIMSIYPYKFGIVPYDYDEKKLLTKGFQFVLMQISSTGVDIKKLLGYDVSEKTKELITAKYDQNGELEEKRFPANAKVFKYYVKHINSGDVYLGEQWDADTYWQDAMKNHLTLLLRELEKKER